MTTPFFSIAIPTKNRPEALRSAIQSVVSQNAADLEIVVCDNSDPQEAQNTAAVAAGFEDPRIRYVRASGDLSMPDNWELAVSEASGEFVGVLTDRSVFRPDALEVIKTEIDRTGALCVSWFSDLYGRDPARPSLRRRGVTRRRYRLESSKLLAYYVNGEAKYATKVVPKLMTAVCHRSVLQEIRDSAVGRCCPPVCPDFTSGFLILSHTDWILTIDESLFVSCGYGTGFAFRRRGELGERFRRDLGLTWAEMVDRMPSEACFSHALVLNDLIRLRDTIPERFPGLEPNRAQYYVGCLNDYAKTANGGAVERDDDFEILLQALAREPIGIRAEVEESRAYTRASSVSARSPVERAARAAAKPRRAVDDAPPFDSVFEAMAWAAAHPREPLESGLLDLVGGVGSRPKSAQAAVEAAREGGGGLRVRLRSALGRRTT